MRLKSELPPKANLLVVWVLVLLLVSGVGILIFGIPRSYAPKSASWWLALPTSIAGLYLAALINRYSQGDPRRGTRYRASPLAMRVFMPLLTGACFALGAPAFWLRMMGPEKEITATVIEVGGSSRSCRDKISLSGPVIGMISGFCVKPEEFDRLHRGQKVALGIREGRFGVLVFSIRPVDMRPE